MPGLLEKNQVGKREDLADIIAVTDMKLTPFSTMVKKGKKPGNTLLEWQVDKYDSPQLAGVVDGTDVTDFQNAAANRVRLKNNIQIFRRTHKNSRLSENVSDVAGASEGELARGIAKKLVEIKRDMESAFLGDNNSQTDNGGIPYLTRGIGKWIVTSDSDQYPVDSAYLPASAQVITTACASLAEDTDLQGMMQAIFDATGMSGDYKLIAGSVLRRRFTDMTRMVPNAGDVAQKSTKIRTFAGEMNSSSVNMSTAIFEGDFGSIEVVPSNFIGLSATSSTVDSDRGYVLDFDKIDVCYSNLPKVERLPDLGGGPRVLIEAVAGLRCFNPIGLGKYLP